MFETPRRALLVVGAVSAAVFLLEVLLTRVFSVTLFYHFAFGAISMGMLGLAAAGVRVALAPQRFKPENGAEDVARAAGWFGLTLLLALGLVVRVGILPAFTWSRVVLLGVIYAVCTVPFYFAGLCLTLLFTHGKARFGALYAADLVAAGAAGLLVYPMLRGLGGPSAVATVAVLAGLAGLIALPAGRPGRRGLAWASVLGGTAFVVAHGAFGFLELRNPKQVGARPMLFEAWNAISRVAVYPLPMGPWTLGPNYREPVALGLYMDIDAHAATPVMRGGAEGNGYLLHELTASAHVAAKRGRALVIGSGGGRDVMAALLAGAAHVDAVEINPIIVDDVMRGRFRTFSGDLYEDPRVSVHVEDGRIFVRRSREQYDLIQLTLVDTWAATTAGAFALSENNLYTLEAVQEYIEHLTADGVLSLTRFGGAEAERLAVLVLEAARRLGTSDPARHIAVIQQQEVRGPRVVAALIFRRSPLDAAATERLRAFAATEGFVWLHDPMAALPTRLSSLARSADPGADARGVTDADLSPPTDDRPFFFHSSRSLQPGLPQLGSRLFADGQYLVASMLVFAAVLGSVTILLPLWRGGHQALAAHATWARRAFPYFSCLGIGFMLVEVSLIQRLALYLGHSTHALTVVLAGLLAGAGLGSGVSSRFGAPRALVLATTLATGVLLTVDVVQPHVLRATREEPFAARVLFALLVVVPVGASLGTLMPLAIRRLTERAGPLVPWAWGLNGFASAVGACAAALGSITWGFSSTQRAGTLCYAVAAVASVAWARREQASYALPADAFPGSTPEAAAEGATRE